MLWIFLGSADGHSYNMQIPHTCTDPCMESYLVRRNLITYNIHGLGRPPAVVPNKPECRIINAEDQALLPAQDLDKDISILLDRPKLDLNWQHNMPKVRIINQGMFGSFILQHDKNGLMPFSLEKFSAHTTTRLLYEHLEYKNGNLNPWIANLYEHHWYAIMFPNTQQHLSIFSSYFYNVFIGSATLNIIQDVF